MVGELSILKENKTKQKQSKKTKKQKQKKNKKKKQENLTHLWNLIITHLRSWKNKQTNKQQL